MRGLPEYPRHVRAGEGRARPLLLYASLTRDPTRSAARVGWSHLATEKTSGLDLILLLEENSGSCATRAALARERCTRQPTSTAGTHPWCLAGGYSLWESVFPALLAVRGGGTTRSYLNRRGYVRYTVPPLLLAAGLSIPCVRVSRVSHYTAEPRTHRAGHALHLQLALAEFPQRRTGESEGTGTDSRTWRPGYFRWS